MLSRTAAVAGRFYPGTAEALSREVARHLRLATTPLDARAIVVPHAGYLFSGPIAGETYGRIVVPGTAIVLCPNHTGMGARRSVWPSGSFRVPGGEVEVDEPLAARLIELGRLEADTLAHQHEHAIEVQLPFLRARNPSVRIVPICLAALSLPECLAIGQAIAEVILGREAEAAATRTRTIAGTAAGRTSASAGAVALAEPLSAGSDRDVLLVASTDFSHYLPAERAEALDQLALRRIEALDPEGLYQVVEENEISMCGYIPTTVVLAATRALGSRRARLVRYGNSGETSGDLDQVVGYGGLVIE